VSLESTFGRRVGVEAAAGELIAVTLRGGHIASARIVNLAETSASAGRTLLGDRRVGAPPVALTICDTDHVHRTLLLPPMTAAEKTDVVRRQATREGEDEKASAWTTVRRVDVDGILNDELLVVMASEAPLQQMLDPLVAGGVVPRVIMTGPLALVAAARALAPMALDRPTALVHWGVASLALVIVSDGVVKFTRVIELPAVELDPFEWIPVEIDRSIRHYSVLSKGERIEQVMVSVASIAGARRVFSGGELAERLRLSVTNLNALLAPELPLGATDAMAAGVFMLAYGAALTRDRDVPNLLPASLVFQQRSRTVITAAVAAGVVLALGIGSNAVSLRVHQRQLQGRLARVQANTRANQAVVEAAAQAAAERERHNDVAKLLTQDPLHLLPPADALRELARLAPADLRLDQVTMTTGDQGYVFSLTGRVELEDFTDAQRVLTDFYYALRGAPLFHSVEIRQTSRIAPAAAAAADQTPAPSAAAPASAPAPQAAQPEPPLGFVVVLQLRRLA